MYEILLSKNALKFLEKLNKKEQEQILSGLEKLRFRPEAFLVKLVGDKAYKLRIGDFRVIVDIQQSNLLVFVIKVGHRKNVYQV